MPLKFYLDKILLYTLVQHSAKPDSTLHMIHRYFSFTPDQALIV